MKAMGIYRPVAKLSLKCADTGTRSPPTWTQTHPLLTGGRGASQHQLLRGRALGAIQAYLHETQVKKQVRIISIVLPSLARRAQALALGMRVVEQRVRQALSLGYYQALEWLKDISLAVRVGLSLLNTPKAYWPEVT